MSLCIPQQASLRTTTTMSLRTHFITHIGEKSTKCDQCEYASTKNGSLKAHLKIHGGETSNKFKRCKYASFHTYNLRVNLKTQIREHLYKCKHCDFALSGLSTLNWATANFGVESNIQERKNVFIPIILCASIYSYFIL